MDAVKLARRIFATRAFAGWATVELLPGQKVATDEQLREFVRQRADSYHHQVGSCKMGWMIWPWWIQALRYVGWKGCG